MNGQVMKACKGGVMPKVTKELMEKSRIKSKKDTERRKNEYKFNNNFFFMH